MYFYHSERVLDTHLMSSPSIVLFVCYNGGMLQCMVYVIVRSIRVYQQKWVLCLPEIVHAYTKDGGMDIRPQI